MAKAKTTAANVKTRDDDRRGTPRGKATMPQPQGGAIGQPPFVATEEQRQFVRENVFWIGQDACAAELGVSARTLRNHMRAEIDAAEQEAQKELGKTAMERAKAGDGPMLRFILATRFPKLWSPKLVHQHGGRVEVDHRIDLSSFLDGKSEEEIALALELVDGLLAAGGFELPGGAGGSEAPALPRPAAEAT